MRGQRRRVVLQAQPQQGVEHAGRPGHTSANQAHHHPREPIAVLYLALLFGLWWANALDLALTLAWTGNVGWAAEGNQIMRHVAATGGAAGFVVYKLLLMTLVVLMLWWLYLKVEDWGFHARRKVDLLKSRAARIGAFVATGSLAGFYSWVVWNNLRIMGYL